jgi:hypothetical protein
MKKLTLRLIVVGLALAISAPLSSCTLLGQRSTLDPHWIFITKDIDWQLPPKEITEEMGLFSDGHGYVMVLYPSGELALVSCDLRKDGNTGQLSLNGVVSFSVDKGTWSRNNDGTLTTVSRFCVAPMGPDRTSEASVERRWTMSDQSPNRVAGLLRSKEEAMVPLPENFRDVDGISYMLSFASACK